MDKLKPYLPFIGALVCSCCLYAFDATQYHNEANQVDSRKVFGAFVALYGLFTGFLKMNPIDDGKENPQ